MQETDSDKEGTPSVRQFSDVPPPNAHIRYHDISDHAHNVSFNLHFQVEVMQGPGPEPFSLEGLIQPKKARSC
jgi:hypothetical protein